MGSRCAAKRNTCVANSQRGQSGKFSRSSWCGQTACNGTDAYSITGNGNNSVIIAADNQWIQYRLNFTSTIINETPVLSKITIKAKSLY